MPSARAVLPATGIGSGRPGKASCALMTFEAESPILGPAMGLERSWRALLAAESMGGVSVPRADLHAWLSLRGKVSRVREAARAKNYAGWAPPQGVRVPPVSPPSRPVFRVPRKGLAKQGFQSVSRAQSTTEQKREISVCIKRQRARRKADCKKMDGWMDGRLGNLPVLISQIDPKHNSQHHKGLRTQREIYIYTQCVCMDKSIL